MQESSALVKRKKMSIFTDPHYFLSKDVASDNYHNISRTVKLKPFGFIVGTKLILLFFLYIYVEIAPPMT